MTEILVFVTIAWAVHLLSKKAVKELLDENNNLK
jgi:hypothetical protein